MARSPENLPEGTDSIIPGAAADEESDIDFTPDAGTLGSEFQASETGELVSAGSAPPPRPQSAGSSAGIKEEAKRVVGEKAAGLREQAADTVRSYALQGKDRATDMLDNVLRTIDDAAATIDDKVGAQYGDYVRRVGDSVEGFASQLRDKDVDDLLDDARQVVRASPALAIGAAAAVGFLIARVVKVGLAPPSQPSASENAGGPAGRTAA